MQKIVPFLWFDDNAEEAASFYTSTFPKSELVGVQRYGPEGPGPEGSVMTVTFRLDGQEFIALNGGPQFHFTEAISFFVNCDGQDEVDELWQKLTAGGEPGPCGWLKDRYGMSWQIVPTALGTMMSDPDPAKVSRVTTAMMKMSKLDVNELRRAYDGPDDHG